MKTNKATREGKEIGKAETAQERAMYALLEASSDEELSRINKRVTAIIAKRNAAALCNVRASFLMAQEPGTTTDRRKARVKIDESKAVSLYAEECLDARALEKMPALCIPVGWATVHAYVVQIALEAFARHEPIKVPVRGAVWQACKANKADPIAAWKAVAGQVKADYIAFKASEIVAAFPSFSHA